MPDTSFRNGPGGPPPSGIQGHHVIISDSYHESILMSCNVNFNRLTRDRIHKANFWHRKEYLQVVQQLIAWRRATE
jgi:hypothetical protein